MDRIPQTLLFIPGNNPAMLLAGGVFEADALILDLEDAVAPREKDAARLLVGEALRHVDFSPSMKVVRINSMDTFGRDDIAFIAACGPDCILVPKVESAETILEAAALLEAHESTPGIRIIALLETPQGIIQAPAIARAHPRLMGLFFGAEDYAAGIGATRTREGGEIQSARMAVHNAASAAGILSIDTVFVDTADEEGLRAETAMVKKLGFKAKAAINPRQIDPIREELSPTSAEINWAERVIQVLEDAKKSGSGVVALDGKMVDAPVALQARTILALAHRGAQGESQ